MGKQDDLLELVGRIYRTALVPAAWRDTLRRTCDLLDAESALFMVSERRSGAPLLGTLYGIDPVSWDIYAAEDFYEQDLWLRRVLDLGGGRVVVGEELVRREVFRASPWRNEFLCRWNIEDVMSYTVFLPKGLAASISVFRPASAEAFSAADKEALGVLARHFEHAVTAHVELARLQCRMAATDLLLERFGLGLVILDRRGEVELMNRAAEAILAAADGLSVRRRRLVAARRGDSVRLTRATEAAVKARPAAEAGAVVVGRPSMKRPYAVQVLPLQGQGAPTAWCLEVAAAAMVLITDPEQRARVPEDALAESYGLTPREAQLAAILAGGEPLGRISERMGITIGTARNHLKSILHKTGCNRQADLVGLLHAHGILRL